MHRILILMVGCLMLLGSCTQKLICPAYQSAFIHDQEALRKRFSYFNEDSTPKIVTVSKNKYLIIPEVSYRKKIRQMKTIEMKEVKVQLPDSLKPGGKKPELGAEQDATDSVATTKPAEEKKDSVYAITKDKEVRVLKYNKDSAKYHIEHITLNADQDNYMWYFRDVLVLPDVRAALQDQKSAKEAKVTAAKKEKSKGGFFGFFKNIFKKKPKKDSTDVKMVVPPPVDSEDPADSTAALDATPVQTATPEAPPKKKKSMFSMFKKKNKKADKKPDEEPKEAPPKEAPAKEEKKDDGF